MDISNLRYFATVAREQHMGRAAEELNITQPSLSVAIRRLEAELGYQLFDRVGRGIRLNEYGQIYLKGVTTALDSLSMSVTEMEEYKKSTSSLVKLSCSGSMKNSQLIDHLIDQGFSLKVNSIPKDLEAALLQKQSDLIITMGLIYNNQIEYDELALHELVFVVGKTHPLAGQKRLLSLDELQHYQFCSMDTPNSLLNVFKAQKKRPGFQPIIAFFGRDSADMYKVIMTGKYVGIMVRQHLPKTGDLQILSIDEPECTVPIYLYWRKSQGIKANIQAIRREIIDFYDMYEYHNDQGHAHC